MTAHPIMLLLAATPAIRIPPEPSVVPVSRWASPLCWATSNNVVASRRQALRNLDQFATFAGLPGSRLLAPADTRAAVLR